MVIKSLFELIDEEVANARRELAVIKSVPKTLLTVEILQGCKERAEELHREVARLAYARNQLTPQTAIVMVTGNTGYC